MALTSSDVYSPANPGLAQVLSPGLGPLHILQQENYRRQREAAAAAKAKSELDKQFTPLTPDVNGGLYWQPEITKSAEDFQKFAKDPYVQAGQGKITANEAKANTAAAFAVHQGKSKKAQEAHDEISRIRSTAIANNLNPGAIDKAIAVMSTDPTTGQAVPISQLDATTFNRTLNENPDYYDRDGVVSSFLKDKLKEEESRYTSAATPGHAGMENIAKSNMFEMHNGKAVMELGPDGKPRPKIKDLALAEQAMLRDPKMAALLRRELDNGASSRAEAIMRISNGAMSTDQADAALESLNASTNTGTGTSRSMADNLIREYGTLSQQRNQLSPKAVPRPVAGGKAKDSDAVATPTSDFGLSVGDNGGMVTTQVPNPNTGGLGNFLTPTISQTSAQAKPFDNHYPVVGQSFASKKAPNIKLLANSGDFTTLGADGTPSKYNGSKTNSMVPLNATDRSFVLEVNGKRMGLPKGGTSADAYAEMKGMIERMTPEQARKAVLKSYYHGGVTDKGKTTGDGAGDKARILGYKDSSGELLSDADATRAKQNKEPLTPVYDQTDQQLKVMHPATAQLDAQAARQTPGYDPKKRTTQEAELIRLLEAKGGRVVDPYHTTATTPNPGGGIYKRPAAANQPTPTTAKPSRGGSIYKAK